MVKFAVFASGSGTNFENLIHHINSGDLADAACVLLVVDKANAGAIERAQRKVEENNFGIRKRLLEYDDVMNSQREVIYTRRRHALYGERIEVDLNNIMVDFAETFVDTYYDNDTDYEDFKFELIRQVAVQPSLM